MTIKTLIGPGVTGRRDRPTLNFMALCKLCGRDATVQVIGTEVTYLCDKHKNELLKKTGTKVNEENDIVPKHELNTKETIH